MSLSELRIWNWNMVFWSSRTTEKCIRGENLEVPMHIPISFPGQHEPQTKNIEQQSFYCVERCRDLCTVPLEIKLIHHCTARQSRGFGLLIPAL